MCGVVNPSAQGYVGCAALQESAKAYDAIMNPHFWTNLEKMVDTMEIMINLLNNLEVDHIGPGRVSISD